jgi:hypothetical protein
MTREEYCELERERKLLEFPVLGLMRIAGVALCEEARIEDRLNDLYQRTKTDVELRRKSKRAKKPKPMDKFHHALFDAEVLPFLAQCAEDDSEELLQRRINNTKALLEAQVDVTPLDVWHVVKSSCTADFGSQGYGAGKYAHGSLLPAKAALLNAGIECHIRVYETQPVKQDAYGHWYESERFELWAPIEPELLSYVILNFGEDARSVHQKHGLNHKVYDPFDPRDPF